MAKTIKFKQNGYDFEATVTQREDYSLLLEVTSGGLSKKGVLTVGSGTVEGVRVDIATFAERLAGELIKVLHSKAAIDEYLNE